MRFCFSSGSADQRAHVVQAVGELDEHHAHVLGHGQQHLAQALGLGMLVARAGRLALEFLDHLHPGHAVDEAGDGRAEFVFQVIERDAAVLHHVVQDRRRQRLVIETEIGEYSGHRQRMLDIGLARGALLARVRPRRQRHGPAQDFPFRFGAARRRANPPRRLSGACRRLSLGAWV